MKRAKQCSTIACTAGLMAALVLTPAGCGGGDGPEMGRVTGTISLDGQPLTKGVVNFQPVASGNPANGTIGPDGTYSLTTFEPGDGAQVGNYLVTVSVRDEKKVQNFIPKTPPPPPKSYIPVKYESPKTSELSTQVKPGLNPISFDLKSK